MNDDELEEVLRRTLRNRAANMRPGRPTSEIPWAEVPQIRRRPMILVGLAAAAIIAVTVGVLLGASGRGGHHQGVTFISTPSTSAPGVVVSPTTAPPPTAAATPSTTTVPLPPVPGNFDPRSVTFVSSRSGWVLGTTPCGPGQCFSLVRTSNGGTSWYTANPAVTLPGLTAGVSPEALQVRFANLVDGWIFTGTQLWSTHDGGDVWEAVPTPGGNQASIEDLEAANGMAYIETVATSPALYSVPVSADNWSQIPVALAQGAGPVDTGQIVLSGDNGRVIDTDRTTIGGARMAAGSPWSAWTPPCVNATGPGVLAAAGPTELTAMCNEGDYGTPAPGTAPGEWLFSSTDGGASFNQVGPIPGTNARFLAVAAGNPRAILVSDSEGIVASFNGGTKWSTVWPAAAQQVEFLGFTTAAQAVAMVADQDGSGASLEMSRDGGHTWAPVNF